MDRFIRFQGQRFRPPVLRHARRAHVVVHRFRRRSGDVDAFQMVPIATIIASEHLHATSLSAETKLTIFSFWRNTSPGDV